MRTQAPNPVNYKSNPEDAIRFANDSIKHNNDFVKQELVDTKEELSQDIADLKDLLSTMEAKQKADPITFKKEVIEPSKVMEKHLDDYLFEGIKSGATFEGFLKDRGVTEYSKNPIFIEGKSAWTGNSQDIIPENLVNSADLTIRYNSAILDDMTVVSSGYRNSQLIVLDKRSEDGRTSEWNPSRPDPDLTDTPTFKANSFYGFKPHKKYILSNELLLENIYGGNLASMITTVCKDDTTQQVENEFLYGSARSGTDTQTAARGLCRDVVDYRTATEEAVGGALPSYTEALKSDETRNRETIQVFKTGVDNGLPTTNKDLLALILKICFSVSRNKYGEDLTWYMPTSVWEYLCTIIDNEGRPLFLKNYYDYKGFKLLGYDVKIVDNMSDPFTGDRKDIGIFFGKLSKCASRSSMHSSMIVDPYTIDGAVKFYQEQWDTSAIAENDALRAIAFTA